MGCGSGGPGLESGDRVKGLGVIDGFEDGGFGLGWKCRGFYVGLCDEGYSAFRLA